MIPSESRSPDKFFQTTQAEYAVADFKDIYAIFGVSLVGIDLGSLPLTIEYDIPVGIPDNRHSR